MSDNQTIRVTLNPGSPVSLVADPQSGALHLTYQGGSEAGLDVSPVQEVARSMRFQVAVNRKGTEGRIPNGWLNTIDQWAEILEKWAAQADEAEKS